MANLITEINSESGVKEDELVIKAKEKESDEGFDPHNQKYHFTCELRVFSRKKVIFE